MELINNYFEEYKSVFVIKLEDIGITNEQAKIFLPFTADAITSVIKNSSLEKTIEILLSDKPSQLLQLIDVSALATKMEMKDNIVESGLEAISPVLSKVFLIKCDELVAVTASLAWKTTDETKNYY